MTLGDDSQTSTTLLRQLRADPADRAAWDRFVDRYGVLIYRWCRHWGLQEADAEDVTQNVLVELLRQMRHFVYDRSGSFRAWLRTIAYRGWCKFIQGKQKQGAALQRLQTSEAYEDLLQQLGREDDREALEKAMALVRLRVQPHTWEAFRMLALDGRPGAEVARELDMNVGAVFVARSKVQKMLRETIERFRDDSCPTPQTGVTSP
jgi:RNA polymerase sigma-70 factor (ECF subfamily)